MLTIITPTYNRASFLEKCYSSLCVQTSFDFEWIIIDDGSSDNTSEIVKQFSNTKFKIVYEKKKNGGKHTALNASHKYINGEYVLILDSDDYLLPNAVEIVNSGWKNNESETLGVLIFLKQLSDGTVCAKGELENTQIDFLDNKRIKNVSIDCCETIKADLFTKYPFPEFEGERFLGESALWYRVGIDYKCMYINVPIYVCEYMEGGLTKSGRRLRIKSCNGGMFNASLRLNERFPLKIRIKNAVLYSCYGFFAGKSLLEIIKKSPSKPIVSAFVPCGFVLFLFWKNKYK